MMSYINGRLDLGFGPLHDKLPHALPKIISRKISKVSKSIWTIDIEEPPIESFVEID